MILNRMQKYITNVMLKLHEKFVKRDNLFILGIMLGLGALFVILYLAHTGNAPQIYTDVVQECTAMDSSNKSAERNLFYLLSFLGLAIYLLYFLFVQNKDSIQNIPVKEAKKSTLVVLLLVVFIGTYYFVYSATNCLLVALALYVLILFVVDNDLVLQGTALFVMCIYSCCALYRIYVYLGGEKDVNLMSIAFLSIFCSLLCLYIRSFLKPIMILQMIIPFSLLVFLSSQYKSEGETFSFHIPYRIQIIIWTLIIGFIVQAIVIIKKYWSNCNSFDSIFSYGTFVSIMVFNRYSGTGVIVPNDLHHPFENIIAYSQMVELGQSAFKEYTPVSGMYSLLQGFFLSFLGHGKFAYYYLTQNIFYLSIIMIIVALLRRQIKSESILLIALVFFVIDYNRIALIAPIMLLLSLPQLINKRNLWLKVWFLSSFIQGLYYPVYGAAVCLGFMPLGIYQIITYIKTGELMRDIKGVRFWCEWIICFLPVLFGFQLLFGTLKHVKALSAQTVYADGISRFGQKVVSNFLSYTQSLSVRLTFYYLFTFLIVVSIIWVSGALCLNLGNIRWKEKRILIGNPIPAFISLSIGITMLVSLSFTVIRLDINDIYARSKGVVYASFIMFVVICSRYLNQIKYKTYVLCFAAFTVAAVSGEGFLNIEANAKLQAAYTVPEDYIFVDRYDQIQKLGECFISQNMYDSIQNAFSYTQSCDKNKSYLAIVPDLGHFYLCDIKGDSVMAYYTIKGYGAANETIDLAIDNKTIIGVNINSIDNYYLYNWLVSSGNYMYSPEERMFLPNDGTYSVEEIHEQNKNIDIARDGMFLGRVPSSWGLSLKSLNNIFSTMDLEYQSVSNNEMIEVSFEHALQGNDADFIYIEFADMAENYQYILFNHYEEDTVLDQDINNYLKALTKKDYNRGMNVIVSWDDESGNPHSMSCNMGQGQLLIPVGGGRGWLLNEHLKISIAVQENEQNIAIPQIVDLKFLKLREAG